MKHLDTSRLACLTFSAATALLLAGCSVDAEPAEQHDHSEVVGESQDALSAAQCSYYAVDGKVQICHRTGSATHPYSILKISQSACTNAHALHAGDYVAVNDPDCQGDGCLPEGAPCDVTVPCCEGFSCTAGTCTANVSNNCSPSPCQNGSTCVNETSGYTCECLAGYTGTNCETEINECDPEPCQNGGTCLDGINAYVCDCLPGWDGTDCEINLCDPGLPVSSDGETYVCACPPGLTGDACEIPWDFDLNNPCLHGGTWNDTNFACDCANGYTGQFCTIFGGEYNCDYNNPCVANSGNYLFASDIRHDYYIQCSELGECSYQGCAEGEVWSQEDLGCVAVTSCPCAEYPGWDANLAVTGGQGMYLSEADALLANQSNYFAIYATGWDPVFLQGNLLLPDTSVTAAVGSTVGSLGACASFSRLSESYFFMEDLSPAEAAACYDDVQPATVRLDTTPLPDLPAPVGFLGAGLLGLAEMGRRIVRRKSK